MDGIAQNVQLLDNVFINFKKCLIPSLPLLLTYARHLIQTHSTLFSRLSNSLAFPVNSLIVLNLYIIMLVFIFVLIDVCPS